MLLNEIAKEVGMTKRAIKYYEEKGLLSIKKDDNGYRNYTQEDVETLKKISIYRKLGISIDDIKQHEKDKSKWNELYTNSKNATIHIPSGLNWLEDKEMFEYLVDMCIASCYASINRIAMMMIISDNISISIDDSNMIETVHNFIDYDDFIIRKGAVNASKSKKLIIPLNNEDGILLCEGLGNKEWNYSAPHGAGRIGPRSHFKDKKHSKQALVRMGKNDIYTSHIPNDETKDSYKDPNIIINAVKDTVIILEQIKPIMNIK